MKCSKIFLTLVLAVSISLLAMVVMPAKPALAQSITLSKYYGYLGTEIIVTGKDFNDYQKSSVYIYFGNKEMKSIIVSETGTFTASINVPSTATPGATYSITIQNIEYQILASQQFFVAKAKIEIDPVTGRIGDWVRIEGNNFDANKEVHIYFSSNKANVGDRIDTQVTAYEDMWLAQYGTTVTNTDGNFKTPYRFTVPSGLTHGKDKEDVHDGEYYIYAAYYPSKDSSGTIEAVAKFTVLGGTIELAPEKGQVGTEVNITGEGLRAEQSVTIRYDSDIIDIASGASRTNSEGSFNCTIIIPETFAGSHLITVMDESGNTPEAEFSVEPKVTIEPTSEVVGNVVKVSGVGFGEKEDVAITLDGNEIPTTPTFIQTNRLGSFNANFLIPDNAQIGTSIVEARDTSLNTAEAQLTILAAPESPASMSLRPSTSLTSPGHVGMELVIEGSRFIANTTVTVTFSNAKPITVAETDTDGGGNFSTSFTVPPVVAGSYTVTASDGSNTVTSVFVMESEAPIMPVPLLPKITSTVEAKTRFDWEGIDDPSGMTYVLQIGADADFTNIVLEKEGLPASEYRLTEEEKLESTNKETPYYWRVKAVDGAFNEGEWTPPGLFYVGSSQTSIPAWVQYSLYGLGGLLLVFLGFWVRRRIASH